MKKMPEMFEFDQNDFTKACREFESLTADFQDRIEDYGFYMLLKIYLDDNDPFGQDFIYCVMVKPLQLTNTLKIFPRIEGMVDSFDCLPDAQKEIDTFYANINKPGFEAKRKAMQSFERLNTPLMPCTAFVYRSKLDWNCRIKGQVVVLDSKLTNTSLTNNRKNTVLLVSKSTLKDCRISSGSWPLLKKVGKPKALPKFIQVWKAPEPLTMLNLDDRNKVQFCELTGVAADDCCLLKCNIKCDPPAEGSLSDDVIRCTAVDCYMTGPTIHIGKADTLHLEKSVVISTVIEQLQCTQNKENPLINALSECERREKALRSLPLCSDSFFFGASIKNCPFILESMIMQKSQVVNSAIAGSVTRDCYIKDSFPRYLNNTVDLDENDLRDYYDIHCKLSFNQEAADRLKEEYGISMDADKFKKLLCNELGISMQDLIDGMYVDSFGTEQYSVPLHDLFGKSSIFAVSSIELEGCFEGIDPALIEFHLKENEKHVKKDLAPLFAKYKD